MDALRGWRLGLFAVLAAGVVAQEPTADVARRATALREAGKTAEALALLDGAILADGKDAALLLLRAAVHLRGEAVDDALADCDRALELLVPTGDLTALVGDAAQVRTIAGALRLRGVVRSKLGEWGASLPDLENATALQPKDSDLWRLRAHTELCLGRLDAAVASLGKAADVHDGDEAMYLKVRSDILLLAERAPAARADLERANKLAKGTPAAVTIELALAAHASVTRNAAAARAAWDRLFASAPEFAGWAALLRWSIAGTSDRGAAERRLRDDFAKLPEDEALLAELFRLCSDGTGDSNGMKLPGRDATARCQLWFFAGCRAAQQGRDAEARVRWLRSVNTGRFDQAQWGLALARLRESARGKKLQPALGIKVAPAAAATTPVLLVTALDEDGAAAIQGLLNGDRIVRVNASPATPAAFEAMTKAIAIATPVRFVVERGGKAQTLRITAGVAAP
ncbi:MAG: hypothetical protein WAT39_03450 [Planctomycetota bacterium]